MFINETELKVILDRVESGKEKLKPTYSLYYYSSSQIISSVGKETFGSEFKLKFKDRVFGSQKLRLSTSKQLIIRPVLNGVIVILINEHKLFKLVLRDFEPHFLANERQAALLIPEFVPELSESGTLGDFDYVVSKYIPKYEWVEFDNWSEMLGIISNPIMKMHKRQKKSLKKLKFKSYAAKLLKMRERYVTNNLFLGEIFDKNTDLYRRLLQMFGSQPEYIYQCFQHGDLTPSNVIRTGDKLYLIDFQNGGILNCFYDLMIQDFYSPNNLVWKKFNSTRFITNSNKDVLKGWSRYYCKMIKSVYNIPISDKFLKVSILLSLIELGNTNFLRYQSKSGIKEGLIIQKILNKIGTNILNS